MKTGWDKLSITTQADVLVKILPAGQLVLRSNPLLCLQVGTEALPKLTLQPCASIPAQLWTIEGTLSDGSFVCGPITSAVDQRVMDIYYSGEDIDTGINVYGWGQTPNQIWNYDNVTGEHLFGGGGVCCCTPSHPSNLGSHLTLPTP